MRRSLSDEFYIVLHCQSTSLWPSGRSASKFYAMYHADTKISSQKRYIMSLHLYNTNARRLWFFGLRKIIYKNPIKYLVYPIRFIYSPVLIQNSLMGYIPSKTNESSNLFNSSIWTIILNVISFSKFVKNKLQFF